MTFLFKLRDVSIYRSDADSDAGSRKGGSRKSGAVPEKKKKKKKQQQREASGSRSRSRSRSGSDSETEKSGRGKRGQPVNEGIF